MSDDLSERIIGAAVEVHRCLGPGLLESIYEEALAVELAMRGVNVVRQVEVDVLYKGHVIKGQRLDMLVEEQVVVELKAVANLPEIVFSQVMSYLKATGLKRGLIINFGKAKLVDGIRRVSRFDAQIYSEPSVTSVAR